MIFTFKSDLDISQQIGVLSVQYDILKNLSTKAELAFLHTKFKGRVNDSHSSFVTSLDLNYSLKQFMINLFVKAKEKQLTNSYIMEETYTKYGGNIRWSNDNWHVEVGVNNPFSDNNNMSQRFVSPEYSNNNLVCNKSFQQSSYLKVIYRFSFGEKHKPENKNINSNIDSAIMKSY